MSFMQEIETDSMGTRQLHSSQKEAMKKIIEFSGEFNETDIDEWLFYLNNLFSLMKLKDETKILETMGKLTGPALRWYQENLRSFTKWDDAEKALRDRFKEFTSGSQLMHEFFQLYQDENQSITSFYENVIRKYRKARQFITEQQVITVLQSGVKLSLKEYLIRNEKDIRKPEEWLQIAREEEYIQNRIQQQRNNFYYETKKQPFFESTLPSATIQSRPLNIQSSSRQTPTPHDSYPKQYRQLTPVPNDRIHQKQNNYERTKHNWKRYPENKMPRSDSCLICNRKNHSTMNCFYKKDNGCFKCGQSNHRIRDCPEQHFFE
ncbi:unnamed protein product [Rotaria socialis]|uniref:CCHC-type domain-containing protein n=1 Tax=Rotaria socialis TaxID=392032 RepID=A0A821YGY6_9BILA|nr:unnamed protein product [Rotaria socialis]